MPGERRSKSISQASFPVRLRDKLAFRGFLLFDREDFVCTWKEDTLLLQNFSSPAASHSTAGE